MITALRIAACGYLAAVGLALGWISYALRQTAAARTRQP